MKEERYLCGVQQTLLLLKRCRVHAVDLVLKEVQTLLAPHRIPHGEALMPLWIEFI